MSGERGGGERGRWVDLPPGSPGLEAEAGELLRRASPAGPPAPESLARVQRRLWSPYRPRHRRGRGAWLGWAVVGAVLLGSGGVVFARFWEGLRAVISPPSASPASPVRRPARPARPRMPTVARAPEPLPAPPPAESAPAPALAPRPVERAAPPPGRLADEAALLAEAVAQLRQHRNAPAALAALDEHRRRHPLGSLRPDAERVRIEALVLLERAGDALAAIEALPPDTVTSSPELLVLRAELRATRSCAAAMADFDRLLARPLAPALAERALYGRAGCHLRRGDRVAARRDLERYRAHFPGGRFIDDVARRLRDLQITHIAP